MYNANAFSSTEDWRYKNKDGFTLVLTFDFIKAIESVVDLNDIKVIYDIGSRDGCQAMELSDWFPESTIHLFEPVPNSYQSCVLQAQNRNNISLYEMALSNEDVTTTFYEVDSKNVGASSLLKINDLSRGWITEGGNIKEISVQAHRADTLIDKKELPIPDLVWMDVQGAELQVLKGFGEHLKHVKVIHTEVGIRPLYEGGTSKDELLNYMTNNSFECVAEIKNQFGREVDLVFVNTRSIRK